MKIINNDFENERKFAELYKSIKNGKKKFDFINLEPTAQMQIEEKRRSRRIKEKEKQRKLKHLHLIK